MLYSTTAGDPCGDANRLGHILSPFSVVVNLRLQ